MSIGSMIFVLVLGFLSMTGLAILFFGLKEEEYDPSEKE